NSGNISNSESSQCLEAIAILLDQSSPKGGIRQTPYLASTLELQLVSLEVCRVCRSPSTLHVTLSANSPAGLWMAPRARHGPSCCSDRSDDDQLTACHHYLGELVGPVETRSRVPPLLPFSVTCRLSSDDLSKGRTTELWTDVERLRLNIADPASSRWKSVVLPRRLKQLLLVGASQGFVKYGWPVHPLPVAVLSPLSTHTSTSLSPLLLLVKLYIDGNFHAPLKTIEWPPSLRQLSFGTRFCQPIGCGVRWPSSLQQLSFKHRFTESITAQDMWPRSLERLVFFGGGFNESLTADLVAWPPNLRKLVLGYGFKKSITGDVWPSSLQDLSLGGFNESIDAVVWPASLEKLTFGKDFNQPVTRAVWPVGLQELTFGASFCQTVHGVAWPQSLRKLTFGIRFNKPVACSRLPASLQELNFGQGFDESLDGAASLVVLQKLTFGNGSNQQVFPLPDSLRELTLTLGPLFNRRVIGVVWPDSLEELSFGEHCTGNFNQPIVGVRWPRSLRRLTFGVYFNQPIIGVSWPAALQEIHFGRHFFRPTAGIRWPPSLKAIYICRVWYSGDGG
ncbi:unnamed protein product, partial [Hapterophycus canaliculatus]